MSYLSVFRRSRQTQAGRLIAPIICFLPVLLLLFTAPIAGAQTLPLPTHAAGFYSAGSVFAVAVDASGRFYIGGSFRFVNGVPRNHLARFNADGTLDTAWNPNPDGGGIGSLVVSGDTVYVTGNFTSIGGRARNGLAALDTGAGAATAWNPNPNFLGILALAVAGDTVYVGGGFTAIGGQARNYLAALDATTGAATAWNPNPDGYGVSALAVAGDTVYVGGSFTAIGGQARNNIASLDAGTGAATAWNPNPDYGVSALAVAGDTVYVGGGFTTIGGQARSGLAALDAETGAATAWNPNPGFPVGDLAVSGNTVYVGGTTSSIGFGGKGTTGHLKALDADTGAATAWNPNLYPYGRSISALAVAGDTVYVGGGFTAIGGQSRDNIAALDATTGMATAWNPNPDGSVGALAVAGDTVYAGGNFSQISGVPRAGFAALPADGTPSPTLTALASSANPASFGQTITFTATVAGQNPTGAVAFTADGNPLADCAAVALSGGNARCVTRNLSVGSHAIGAAYGGDAGNTPSSAAPLTQTVRNAFTGASPTGQGDVGADFSGGGDDCHLTQAALVDSPAVPPPGYSFPHGLLRFTLDGACAGPVTVRVTYPTVLPAGATFWKYGRTADDATPHWYTLPATLAGATVTFALIDGGLGDDDLAVNGGITDDGGVGVPAIDIPTLSDWLALLLAMLLLGYGGWRLRQSRSF